MVKNKYEDSEVSSNAVLSTIITRAEVDADAYGDRVKTEGSFLQIANALNSDYEKAVASGNADEINSLETQSMLLSDTFAYFSSLRSNVIPQTPEAETPRDFTEEEMVTYLNLVYATGPGEIRGRLDTVLDSCVRSTDPEAKSFVPAIKKLIFKTNAA